MYNDILITLYQGYTLSIGHIIVIDFDLLAEVVFVKFLHYKVTVLSSFPQCPLWTEVTVYSPHLQHEELRFISLKANKLLKFFCTEYLLILLKLLIYPIINL